MTESYSYTSRPVDNRVTLAITGASGAPYALRLLENLLAQQQQVLLLMSSAARVVFATEEDMQLSANPKTMATQLCEHFKVSQEQLSVYGKEEWFSPVASGSAAPKRMVVCPCSTGTLAAIAHGNSDNLIERAADVVLKERGQLLLVPREMPFSTIHLQNMLTLSQAGATIMPAAPGFYHQPQSIADLIDFVVARILDHLQLEQTLVPRWGYTRNTQQDSKGE
ncbi:aromatic acid decarboxylase [Aliidiomarina sedimenti]|uniref:Flavin prenyltransferase UbiX n=2 Tax=Aliidiomarina TaxID=1249554 RepID=A0A432WDQ9_9GAMM|nr:MULTISPECIES: flavin prenyltransferase UbiX [Aliidiomarina]RUO27936.1 aromatic acid decarboxylase [Aliidiomarina sedimenti]RUO31017.1 aromatic acid decarboxylase [Aliidiomarina soli]